MQSSENHNKEYRLLALAIVFFLVGLFFFLRDNAPAAPASPSLSSQSKPAVSVLSAQSALSTLPPNSPFANFPPSSQFHTFIYDGTDLNGNASFTISAVCHDTYVTILIFPAIVDYRENMARAIYNEAIPCDFGKEFSLVIHSSDLSHAPSGTYYYFTADQGTTGAWYNPR